MEENAEPFCEKSWFQMGVNCKIFPQDSSSGRNWFADTKGADRAGQRQQPLDEDIKTAALEALVPSELEQHLAMNRARLITYEQVRSEIHDFIAARRSQFAFEDSCWKRAVDSFPSSSPSLRSNVPCAIQCLHLYHFVSRTRTLSVLYVDDRRA